MDRNSPFPLDPSAPHTCGFVPPATLEPMVVVTGSVLDGYTLWGPFDDTEQALAWADRNVDGGYFIDNLRRPT